ncbi:class I SAM-dependent methyltransferase [Alphaproteobacteria bacterium]|nr:class I SAM-dependent methyltransferase [Alphaproteobacteria bacterium]
MNIKIYMKFNLKKIKCPTCEESTLKYLGLRGGKYQRLKLGIETKIVQCVKCSLIFPNPFPFANNLDEVYNDHSTYFENKSEWHIHKEKMRHIVDKFIEKIEMSINKKIHMLDVGAGRGEFVSACNDSKQINALGIEISTNFIQYAKKQKVNLSNKSLENLIENGYNFDGICLQAVIEHVHDPDEIIKNISKLLRKDGILYIDCPQEPNLLTIIGNFFNKLTLKKGVYNLQPTWEPYHVYGFNIKSLSKLLNKYDLKIIEKLIWADPYVKPLSKSFFEITKCYLATKINQVSNFIGLASNMCVWVKKIK